MFFFLIDGFMTVAVNVSDPLASTTELMKADVHYVLILKIRISMIQSKRMNMTMGKTMNHSMDYTRNILKHLYLSLVDLNSGLIFVNYKDH